MAIEITGDFDELIVEIRQTGERARKNAARRMGQEAERIQQLARDYAPVDSEGIEESIRVEKEGGERIGERVSFTVFVDGDHIAPDGTPVGEYAFMQHEGLVRAKGGGWTYNWHPGPKTRQKMAELGVFCGPKFLERAADEREQEIAESVFNAVRSDE